MPKTIELYTDGACSGNPGPGGWGALLRWNGHEKELSGSAQDTTNNRMELQAIISGLAAIQADGAQVHIFTDSKYVLQGATEWLAGWQRKNWRSASGKPVKNVDLWQELAQQMQRFSLEWTWVKGHAGHPENERADSLATAAIQRYAER